MTDSWNIWLSAYYVTLHFLYYILTSKEFSKSNYICFFLISFFWFLFNFKIVMILVLTIILILIIIVVPILSASPSRPNSLVHTHPYVNIYTENHIKIHTKNFSILVFIIMYMCTNNINRVTTCIDTCINLEQALLYILHYPSS